VTGTLLLSNFVLVFLWRIEMNALDRLTFTAVLAASLLLAACSSTPVAPPETAKETAPAIAAPAANSDSVANQPTVTPAVAATPLAPYLDPANPLYKERSAYFDFDQSAIRPDAVPVIELHGKYLAVHPAVSIRIEGNTDELGGSEYNLALGQKRAQAVLKALKMYGVKDSQMEAVSFGKEKPKAAGHDEAAYAQNRRADLAYPAK